jgi:hypothetical protein
MGSPLGSLRYYIDTLRQLHDMVANPSEFRASELTALSRHERAQLMTSLQHRGFIRRKGRDPQGNTIWQMPAKVVQKVRDPEVVQV